MAQPHTRTDDMPTQTFQQDESGPRAAMRDAAESLMDLHRTLLDDAIRRYEDEYGALLGPLDVLRLATCDPSFGWLRPLSELIVDIDEQLDRSPSERVDVDAIRTN